MTSKDFLFRRSGQSWKHHPRGTQNAPEIKIQSPQSPYGEANKLIQEVAVMPPLMVLNFPAAAARPLAHSSNEVLLVWNFQADVKSQCYINGFGISRRPLSAHMFPPIGHPRKCCNAVCILFL